VATGRVIHMKPSDSTSAPLSRREAILSLAGICASGILGKGEPAWPATGRTKMEITCMIRYQIDP
jgi:hypothetical protein